MTRLLGLVALLMVAPLAALGQSLEEKADEARATGVAALDKKQYDTAIALFEESYRIKPTILAVLGLGFSYKALYKERKDPEYLRHAIAHFRAASSMEDAGSYRPNINKELSELEPEWRLRAANGEVSATLPKVGGVAIAKAASDRAEALFKRGEHLAAAKAFEEAYQARPRPPYLFAIAASFEQGRDYARAVELYRRYLRASPDGDDVVAVLDRIAVLEAAMKRLEAIPELPSEPPPVLASAPIRGLAAVKTQLMISSRTPGARGSIDGGPLGEIGVARDVKPGQHVVRVEAPGFVANEVFETAVEGRLVVSTLELEPQDARVTFDTPKGAIVEVNGQRVPRELRVPAGRYQVAISRRGRVPLSYALELERGQKLEMRVELRRTRQRTASYWIAGGAGVLALGGLTTTILAVIAQGEASDIDARRFSEPLGPADRDALNNALSRRDKSRTASIVLFSTAAATAATAAGLYWFDTPEPNRGSSVRLVPAGLGASVTGSF